MICFCCGAPLASGGAESSREFKRCQSCGSSDRDRYIVFATIGAAAQLAREDGSPLRIVGISDFITVQDKLSSLFGSSYRNHQYHEEPFLDLLKLRPDQVEMADVVTCSDVLEHVPNPAAEATAGLCRVLKPGGIAVLSVPHRGVDDEHLEHFPVLTEARIEGSEEAREYVGVDAGGVERRYGDLVFHGGGGHTLEHRLYSRTSFRETLLAGGFADAYPLMRNYPQLGMAWEPWSRVWIANK